MPIDYTYGSPGILAFAAQRVGAGQAARRDEEREREIALRQQQQAIDTALQVARMNQQGQQFNQNLAYNAGRDRRQSNFNAAQLMAGAAQREAEAQREIAAGDIGFQRQIALAQLGQQFKQDDAQQGLQLYQDKSLIDSAAQRDQSQFEFGIDAAKAADDQARTMLNEYRKFPLDEDGRKELNEFSLRFRRLQGQKDSLRPGQYTQAVGELMDQMKQADIGSKVETPPSIQAFREQGQITDEKDEDGNTVGWWTIDTRNGVPSPRFVPKPKGGTELTGDKQPMSTPFGQMTPDKAHTTKLDLMSRARQELIDEATTPGAEGPKSYPKKEKIVERAREIMQMEQELFGGQGSNAPPEFSTLQEADQANHVGEFTIKGKRLFRDKSGKIFAAD